LIDHKNSFGETPLHLACLKGSLQFVKLLIGLGCSIYSLTTESQSIYQYATQSDNNTEELLAYLEEQMEISSSSDSTPKSSSPTELSPETLEQISDTTLEKEIPQHKTACNSSESSIDVNSVVELDMKQMKENKNNKKSKNKFEDKIERFELLLQGVGTNSIDLINQYKEQLQQQQNIQQKQSNKKFKIISVDGGGIKCLLQIIIFCRLQEKYPTLFDDVDLFCGVSASSFLCCLLACGMNPVDIQVLSLELCKHVFDKKSRGIMESMYSNKYFIEIANKAFGENKLTDLKKKVLINAFQFDTGINDPNRTCKACVFDNFIEGHDCKIADAILRSAAAVGYFPPYQGYADGGIFENNPCTFAFPFVFGENGLHIPLENTVCLSISSGRNPITYIDSEKYTDVGMLQLLPLVMNGFF
jgi:hypothetical protein